MAEINDMNRRVTAGRVWWAVTGMFALNGGLFGIWASRIPAFKDRFELDHSSLGLLLLLLGMGAILSFPLAGRLTDRFGAAPISRGLASLNFLSLVAIGFAPDIPLLTVALFLFGATHGAMDVAMNAWAAEADRAHRRADMPVYHAMWSLGAGIGASTGALATMVAASPQLHFLVGGTGFAAVALALAAIPWPSARATPATGSGGLRLPTGPLLLVGILAACSTLGEGAMADWSAVYLRDATNASETLAAIGYAVFSATMVLVRLGGATLTQRLGPVLSIRVSGGAALVGTVFLVVIATPVFALAGLVFLGLGYALVVPLAFSRAANDPDLPQAQAIARVATLSYGGMLMGPPTIGFIAHAIGLQSAFALFGLLALLTVALAPVLRPSW